MARPIVSKIKPFDANNPHEISILWTGSLAHANRIIIYDNETNNVVFDDTVSTFALKHTIPERTLENGKKYVIQAQTYDADNTPSSLSDKVLFFTFNAPDFRFDNIPENEEITASSFQASVYYYSPDHENIGTYKFYIYDSTKRQLSESGVMIDVSGIKYDYRGLENNTAYYIRCAGVTVNGMEIDTGYVRIIVNSGRLNTYAQIHATPLPLQGCVQLASNLIIIQYNGTDHYEYDNGMINLVGKILYYNEGFLIDDDFTIIINGINLWQNADIFKISNGIFDLTLSSHIYTNEKLRFRLLVPNGIGNYLLYSEEQAFGNEDMITIVIRRKNNLYQLNVLKTLEYAIDALMGGE